MLLRSLELLIFSILFQHQALADVALDDLFITSDRLVLDQRNTSADFSGTVVAYADDIILKTSKLVTKIQDRNKKRVIDSIILPTKLTVIKRNADAVIIADSAEYMPSVGTLIFKGNIYMQQKQNFMKCDKLIYHTQIKTITTHE